MLKEYDVQLKIRKIDHVIRCLNTSEQSHHQKEYIQHLKRLKKVYEKEYDKCLIRQDSDSNDGLDYIRNFKPRDGRFV